MLKNDERFHISMKFLEKGFWIWKLRIEKLSVQGNLGRAYESCDLLYEFPAETWLLVYRQLDINERKIPLC